MQGNWINEICSTVGTGPLVLTGPVSTKFTTVSSQFRDQFTIQYKITDGNDSEFGLGIYNSGTNTITRTSVLETMVGGTYSNPASAVAITLSGNATVACEAMAGSQPNITTGGLDAVHKDIGDNMPFIKSFSSILIQNRLVYTPMLLSRPRMMNTLYVRLDSTDPGAAASKLAMYTCRPDGMPGALIEQVNIDVVTSTGLIAADSFIAPIHFPAGWYYFAMCVDGAPSILTSSIDEIYPLPFAADMSIPRKRTPMENLTGGWTNLPTIANAIISNNIPYLVGWD